MFATFPRPNNNVRQVINLQPPTGEKWMHVCRSWKVFKGHVAFRGKVTAVGPIVNVVLTYRALKTQALKSSVYLNTFAEHTLEVIMRQLSEICWKVYVQVENVLCLSEIDIFPSNSVLLSHCLTNTCVFHGFFLRTLCEPFIIDFSSLWKRICPHS